MITLITGAPGAGKTALLVEWLRTLYKDRPLYVHGLNGLTLDHIPVDASKWHEELPDGSILVIDEVQQVWRPRGPGHAPSASVQALETHRHRGIDIFLTTQKPNLVDANVRGLVGRHVHIRDTGWLGRWMYEWPECSENLAWKTCSVKRRYKLPSKAFGLYKSASQHTNPAKIKSMMPLITVGLVALSLVLVWLVYRVINRNTEPADQAKPQAEVGVNAPGQQTQRLQAKDDHSPPGRHSWPVYESRDQAQDPDPYHGRALQIEGQWIQAGQPYAYFGLLIDGARVSTVTLAQLVRMGYEYTELGPCAALLRYGKRERVLTCGKPAEPPRQPGQQRPEPAMASAAASSPFGML